LRFVLAIVLFVVAFVSMGLGIAQRTFLAGPSKVTESAVVDSTAPFTIIDGSTLNAHDGTQSISVSGGDGVFVAYGRTVDVMAWVGEAGYTELSSPKNPEESSDFTSKTVRGSETGAPNPTGSDLWIQEFTSESQLTRKLNVPNDISVIIASDGTKPAPANVSVTWPIDNSTPWSGPLLLGGVAVLLAGIIALLWALVHARKVRGPRRKTPRMPRNPKPPRLKPAPQRRAIEAPEKVGSHGRRRLFVALATVSVGAVALTGCSTPGDASTSSPSPSASSIGQDAELESPAVTAPQVKRILMRIGETLAAADEAKDATAAATRLDGPALELRKANYVIRTNDSAIAAPAAIPTGTVDVLLPEQKDGWPRAVFAVVSDTNNPTAAPTAVLLTQQSPRDNYKVHYTMSLDHDLPKVAPASIGATTLSKDSKTLLVQPDQLAAQYGDVLVKGKDSEFYDVFETEGDNLQTSLGSEYKANKKANTPSSAAIDFADAAGPGQIVSFATNDSGAIVAVDLRENETIRPVEAGAAINPEAGGPVKAYTGKAQSTRGFVTQWAVQILFYVPSVTAPDQKVKVLGFAQGLVSAAEIG
jgi:hypothetical protein